MSTWGRRLKKSQMSTATKDQLLKNFIESNEDWALFKAASQAFLNSREVDYDTLNHFFHNHKVSSQGRSKIVKAPITVKTPLHDVF